MIDLNKLKMGYFILYKAEGPIGKIIQLQQLRGGHSQEAASYGHVEVSGGGPYSVYVQYGGKSKPIDITKAHKGCEICVVKYVGYGRSKNRYKVAYWSATHANLRYDYMGILAFLFKKAKQSKENYFCSESAITSLRKEYPEALEGVPADKVMPAHFLDSNNFKVVFKGVI